MKAILDRWEFERSLWARNIDGIAGVDEAGRGPLAGPVVAAAVILPRHWAADGLPPDLEGLNDSKQVSVNRRDRYFASLMNCPQVQKAIAVVEASTIDSINILRATHQGMKAAILELGASVGHVLVDGTPVRIFPCPETALVKGDSRSYSIAAASILAKVTRDRLMLGYDARWPQYGFAVHKGYPTPQHLEALQRWGPCEIHRRSFGPVRQGTGFQPSLFP